MGNAQDVARYLAAHPEIIKTKRLAILSNRYHLKRARLIFESHPYFQRQGITFEPLPTEKLLVRRSKHYQTWVTKLYKTPQMVQRRRMEQKGIKDLKSGKYNPLSS
jgi:uncharacterized SAM-binding protein YcdF (DUF218 family)